MRLLASIAALFFLAAGCAEFHAIFDEGTRTSPPARLKPLRRGENTQMAGVSTHNNHDAEQKEEFEVRQPIATRKGIYYFVKPGDMLTDIASRYRISKNHLAQINDLSDSKLVAGRRLFIPNHKTKHEFLSVTSVISREKLVQNTSPREPRFTWPLKKYRVTSKYGWRRGRTHEGVDLAARSGTPIYAAEEGRVIYAKRFAGYGNLIVLKHEGNYFTAYAHAQNVLVSPGKHVKKGRRIATVGRTGRATGPHLHFEIRKGLKAVDPLTVLTAQ